jgi:hypothetical protein
MAARTRREVPSTDTGLMPMPQCREADLLDAHLVLQELDDLQRLRVGLPFDAGVDVLGVLAEDAMSVQVGSSAATARP